ncbi:alpha/beta fold hydrolase [Gordonia sp. NPDC003950]
MPSVRTVELPSGVLEYREVAPAGRATNLPPVVFVHGVVVDGRMWESVAARLGVAGFHCYLPTLPLGAHRIPWGSDADRSPRGAATLVREFVAELGLSAAILVGCDTGGAVCQFALDADPGFVGRVVFTNCDAFEQFPPQPFRIIFGLLTQRSLLRPLIAGPLQLRALRHSALGVGLLITDPDPTYTRSVFDPLRTDPAIRDDFVTFLRAIDRRELAELTPRLSRVTCPVSVVWGMSDKAFRPTLGRRLAAVFEQGEFIEVANSRTFVAMDQPEALAESIIANSRKVGITTE